MIKRLYKFADPEDLYGIAVPEDTKTYTAVSNHLAISSIKDGLKRIGLDVVEEEYKLSKTGQVATGKLYIGSPENGLQRCVGVINSYDKSKALGIACGANVTICANGLFTSEIVSLRKHTKFVIDDMTSMIDRALRYLQLSFDHACQAKLFLESVTLNPSAVNEIIGQLYLEQELVKSEQLSIIKYGIKYDDNFNLKSNPSMWNLYNLITESFKSSRASTYLGDHVALHNYMLNKAEEWQLPGIPQRVSILKSAIEAIPAEIVEEPVLFESVEEFADVV